ncbi:MAG: hypothetical protein R3321_06595 [Nitrososphaeraceae archaeon]|nr:hypothetical protein [Nitrososphaeraceae archaeon]
MNENEKLLQSLKENLELTDQEIAIFLLIIFEGKKTLKEISSNLSYPLDNTKTIILSLITKGILLEYSDNLYESFHPRFVVINRYKRLCYEKKIELKRNQIIDNLGLILERHYDNVRTK